MKKNKNLLMGLAMALVMPFLFTGCTVNYASTDMMALIVGDGEQKAPTVIEVVYPGGKGDFTRVDTETYYIPSNTRNYRVAPDSVDQTTPVTGRTSTGTEVNVYLTATWIVNQDYDVLTGKFWPFCRKYQCASKSVDDRGGSYAPTDGWNGMLSENFGPAIGEAVRLAMPQFDDTVWKDQAGWDELAAAVSPLFSEALRRMTSLTDDIACGAGDISGWAGVPGPDGQFTCGPVTFHVTSVTAANQAQQQSQNDASAAQQQVDANRAILEAATAKYGSEQVAGETLAVIDMIEACRAAGVACTVVIDGSGRAAVVPTTVTGG